MAIFGTSGDDDLLGTNNNDVIYAQGGNDSVDGLAGYDTIYGGSGDDELYGGTDHFGQKDTLYGESGSDTLTAIGWHGGDQLEGGADDDTYIVEIYENGFDPASPTLKENFNEGYDTVKTYSNWTLGDNFEALRLMEENPPSGTGGFATQGTGNALNNEIVGNSLDNQLFGGLGNDNLYGEDGNDSLYAGTTAGNHYDEEFLAGGGGSDYLLGGNGIDRLEGGEGTDVMEGRGGNDTYVVDNVGDRIIDGSGSGVETVEATVSWTLQSGLDHLYLYGSNHINGTGNGFNNTIDANSGNNVLNGKEGNDSLTGNGGNDTLIGGWGKDIFRFIDPSDGVDTIKDFSVADDTIQIVGSNFDSNLTTNAVLNSSRFVVGSSAQDSSDRFIYNKSTGSLFFDIDGKGGAAQIKLAQLSTGLSMTNQDIYVI